MRKFPIIVMTFLSLSLSGKAQESTDIMELSPSMILNELSTLGNTGGDDQAGVEAGPDPGLVPVDGGLSMLLAAGALLGGSRIGRQRVVKSTVK